MDAFRLHQHLIGQQGSRRSLNTPVLVIDLAAMDANIATLAAFARRHGRNLRPHSKTHKSPQIAQRQIDAGALGVCCAKLGEAEAMVDHNIGGVLITSPVVTPQGIERLIALNQRVAAGPGGLMQTVDNPANIAALEAAAAKAGATLDLVLDIDPGMHRTGASDDSQVVKLARQIANAKHLRFAGVQFYSGRLQHVEDFAERRAAVERETTRLKRLVEDLRSAGLPPGIVTGSGTGTHGIDAELGVFTEWQCGSYIFMDVQYESVDLRGGTSPFAQSLFVDTTVISANTSGMATADAGLKAFATDGPMPVIASGAPAGSSYRFFGDEYGAVTLPPGASLPIGSLLSCRPPHCDPTVNLYDAYHIVRGDTLIDIWPIVGRGLSR
jgi:D-serine deaminase-like pyridoxal phosphate-dependent protein